MRSARRGPPPNRRCHTLRRISGIPHDRRHATTARPISRRPLRVYCDHNDDSSSEKGTIRHRTGLYHADTTDEEGECDPVPFFQHEEVRNHVGMTWMKPSKLLLDRLMSYRYYLLQRTQGARNRQATGMVRQLMKRMELTMHEYNFVGDDSILVLDFLTCLVEEADILSKKEGQAFISLPYLLTSHASRQFRASRNGARSGGIDVHQYRFSIS